MPEGHTIHRLAERHRKLFGGRPVEVSSPQGRFAAGAQRLDGRVLEATEAHGKHLLHHYSGGDTLHIHLGLYGKFTDGDGPAPAEVGEIRLRMVNADHWLDLRGPTACELLDPGEVDALHARLGPDPLAADDDGDTAFARIRGSGRTLMGLLMDQSIVAGAGLIYVTEALFRAGLPPTTTGKRLRYGQWQAIWADLRTLMRSGVADGRIDTVHSAHTPEAMGRAPRVDRHGGEVYVYRRTGQPCLVCGTPVRTAVLTARNAYWCPLCQREP
ncbi:zinc finger domain-containing protein [Dactylosporangium sp. AC04546]|uniref:Fpg/Nei family DNA glycosylase n=1 Tax=Dactylosporangium sp. AC04546 TaxID=2862460 RepID=UPI001EDFED96|nr:DNA-formamidopyrimidine glycosylase family protein [Dactylosporangium sp. AC04546]WVK84759.1 zinc finger domain-containing protein [Dactylosporangium sp. AC04546]